MEAVTVAVAVTVENEEIADFFPRAAEWPDGRTRDFADTGWTNYFVRFYRIRSP
jgi:hypothetical protein